MPQTEFIHRRGATMAAIFLIVAFVASACGSTTPPSSRYPSGTILAVGAENEYANVISQIGGKYVTVSAVMSNPNTDPHTFESSAAVSSEVGDAQLVVQNGVGYDTFMNTIENASPSSSRKVIDVQNLLGLPGTTPNPHVWYNPTTMPAVATAIATDLAELQPAHASYFHTNATTFIASLRPWLQAIAAFKAKYGGTPVATSEPVADYMLEAAGTQNKTPFVLQADVMNGVDLSPQDVTLQDNLFTSHAVSVFVYNEQVTDSVTEAFLKLAQHNDIPVVGVYETMPTPGYDYQTWMVAEVEAIHNAVVNHVSTQKL